MSLRVSGFGPVLSKGQFQSQISQVLCPDHVSLCPLRGLASPGEAESRLGGSLVLSWLHPGYLGGCFFLSALGCGYPEVLCHKQIGFPHLTNQRLYSPLQGLQKTGLISKAGWHLRPELARATIQGLVRRACLPKRIKQSTVG